MKRRLKSAVSKPTKMPRKPTLVRVSVTSVTRANSAAVERAKRAARDVEIISREAKRLNKEARDVLGYQRLP
jgi:hypothetical protein